MTVKSRRFTDAFVKALRPRETRYTEWEPGSGGFGVRVAPTARKSWVWLYRYEGAARRMTLGSYPTMTLAGARKAWGEAQAKLAEGEDPGAAVVEGRATERSADTVRQMVASYVEKFAAKKRSGHEDRRILEKDVLPRWGNRKAKSITRRAIIELLDEVAERGPVIGNRTHAVIRKMFRWAAKRDMLAGDPTVGIDPPGGRETARERILSDEEIRSLWTGLDGAKMSAHTRLAIQLLLVTVQRRGEVAAIEMADINEDKRVWEIPGAKAKNGRPHRVPLSDLALSIIHTAKEAPVGESYHSPRWLFPSREGKSITAASISRAVRNNLDLLGLDNVTPQDLRRTGASAVGEMGFPRLVIEKLLNHTDGTPTAIYDRFSYIDQKRDALDAWAARLEAIISGEPMPAGLSWFVHVMDPTVA